MKDILKITVTLGGRIPRKSCIEIIDEIISVCRAELDIDNIQMLG